MTPCSRREPRRSRFKGFTAVSFHVVKCERPRSAVRCDPRRGRRLFVTWRVARHSLRRNVAVSIWTDSNGVIFVTDSRSYLARFAHTVTVQARKIRPSSAGDFRDRRSYQCSPRFHTSLGATFLWKTGVLRSLWILLTSKTFDFKGADPAFRSFFIVHN